MKTIKKKISGEYGKKMPFMRALNTLCCSIYKENN